MVSLHGHSMHPIVFSENCRMSKCAIAVGQRVSYFCSKVDCGVQPQITTETFRISITLQFTFNSCENPGGTFGCQSTFIFPGILYHVNSGYLQIETAFSIGCRFKYHAVTYTNIRQPASLLQHLHFSDQGYYR